MAWRQDASGSSNSEQVQDVGADNGAAADLESQSPSLPPLLLLLHAREVELLRLGKAPVRVVAPLPRALRSVLQSTGLMRFACELCVVYMRVCVVPGCGCTQLRVASPQVGGVANRLAVESLATLPAWRAPPPPQTTKLLPWGGVLVNPMLYCVAL